MNSQILTLICAFCATSMIVALDTSFRKDFYLSNNQYDESFAKDAGKQGGRIQIVTKASPGLEIAYPLTVDMGSFQLKIESSSTDGQSAPVNNLDWMRCYYDKLSGTVITSLHVDSDSALNGITKHQVTDASGNTVVAAEDISSGSFQDTKMQVTYVTTRNDYTEMIIHLHNYENQ